MSEADTPWEPVETLRAAHPCFQLEDELFVEGGEVLCTATITYGRSIAVAKE